MFSKFFKKNSPVAKDVSHRQPIKLHACKAFAIDLCTYARTKKSTFLKSYKTVILQTSKSVSLDSLYKPCSSTSKNKGKPNDPIDTGIDREDQSNDDYEYVFVPTAVPDFDKNGFENSLDSIAIDESDEDFDIFYDSLENPEIDPLAKTIICPLSVFAQQSAFADELWLYYYDYTFTSPPSVPTQKLSPIKSVKVKYNSSEKKEIIDFILDLNSAPKQLSSFSKKQLPHTIEFSSKDPHKTVKLACSPNDDRRTKFAKTL